MASEQLPFTFRSGACTDTTAKISVMSLSGAAANININGVDYPVTMVARGEDGEGGATDSGDVVGLEVALYSEVQVITGLTANTHYPFTVTQGGVDITGALHMNPTDNSTFKLWFVSCDGHCPGRGVPVPTDRYSVGMYNVIRQDIEDRSIPCVALIHIDDHGYMDDGTVDDTAATGRFCGSPSAEDTEYSYLTGYGSYLGLMGDITADGDSRNDAGFMQARFINEDRHWCWHNVATYNQVGDHEYLGDQGGVLKKVSTYINARNAWDHTLGLNCPDYLDQTAVGDYKGVGTGWVHNIGPCQLIAPDREYKASGPAASDISSIAVGATTTINTTPSHYFNNAGQMAVLENVTGSPDINGNHVITSITDDNTIVIDLDSQGGGPYSGGTVKGLACKDSITGWAANGATENYFTEEQVDLILAEVEGDASKWRLICSSVDTFYQAPIAVMDAASVAREEDPLNNLGGGRYASQQPLGGFNPREMKRLMTQDNSGGNSAQGIMGKMVRKGSQGIWMSGDRHHPGCKVHYRPPADSTSDWMRLVQLQSGSVNSSTGAQPMHEDCLTKWKSYEGTTQYWMPPLDHQTVAESIANPQPDSIQYQISAIRMIVNGENSIEFTIFNELEEVLFKTTMIAGEGNIPADLGFFNGTGVQSSDDGLV